MMCRLQLGLKAPALALAGERLHRILGQAKSQNEGLAWPGFQLWHEKKSYSLEILYVHAT